MKIEVGESLIYSWLRHVKGCQIVQNNWKTSPYWDLFHEADLLILKDAVEKHFSIKEYDVFKKNCSLVQILSQGECDALGISDDSGCRTYYGIDVAFHRGGVNYGGRTKTVAKIVEKCIRTAMCIYGYLDCKEGNIYFISPKIGDKIKSELLIAIDELQKITDGLEYSFHFNIYSNTDFETKVLSPVILSAQQVDDTAELFLRSFQLIDMFPDTKKLNTKYGSKVSVGTSTSSVYREFKIGQLANIVLRNILESGKVSADEIEHLLDKDWSKKTFNLQYPVLTPIRDKDNSIRYYATAIHIKKADYYLCSQWFETQANNDRPYLEKWIEEHK